jgi:hypothetical protein
MTLPTVPEPTGARRFCCALAGIDAVSERLAVTALHRSRERFGDDVVDGLLAAFDGGGVDAVQQHQDVGAARALTYFLYTGVLPDASGEPDPRQSEVDEADYFESVLWPVVQAHPRALSGGYFGHWHYPPEEGDGSDGRGA